jgi:hypothetical protein
VALTASTSFAARATRCVSAASLLLTLGCGGSPTAPSPAAPAASFAVSTFSFTSDPQDFIARGESHVFTLENARIVGNVARSGALISVAVQPTGDPPAPEWSLLVIAPTGRIAPGTYETTRFNTVTTYGMDFVWSQRMCNTAAGHLVIHSVEFAPDLLSLRHFRASFENHCNGSSAAVHGEVAVLADPVR